MDLRVLPDGRSHLTVDDDLGRSWTIITLRAVAGFQWRVYCHRETVAGFEKSLELLHPGGIAHGWVDLDDDLEERSKVLLAVMGLFNTQASSTASSKPSSGTV